MGNRQCAACSRATDMFLCWSCCKDLKKRLDAAAWLALELDVTLTRQDRIGEPGDRIGGTPESPLPFHLAASEAVWVLRNTLTTWAREICETRGIEYLPLGYLPSSFVGPLRPGEKCVPQNFTESTNGVARWLSHNAVAVALSEGAGEAFDEISEAVKSAQRVIDRPPGRIYIGPCGGAFNGVPCDADIYVTMGQPETRCPICGSTYSVDERREQLREQVRGLLGTAAELARLLPWVLDSPITRKRIAYYANRGFISRRDLGGETVFQIGEVIDAHIQCEARRAA